MSSQNIGDLSRSSSSTMRNRSMNPGVQAKLLAFQAKRQQQIQQHKQQQQQDQDEYYSPDDSKLLSSSNQSPSTPLSLNSSTFSSPMTTPNEIQDSKNDDESLIRRTSFRLPKSSSDTDDSCATLGSTSNNPNNPSDCDLKREGSYTNINTANSTNSAPNLFPSNKSNEYIARIHKFQQSAKKSENSSPNNIAAIDSRPPVSSLPPLPPLPSLPSLPSLSSLPPLKMNKQISNKNLELGSKSSSESSPLESKKPSLSQRRGMKLNLGALAGRLDSDSPETASAPASAIKDVSSTLNPSAVSAPLSLAADNIITTNTNTNRTRINLNNSTLVSPSSPNSYSRPAPINTSLSSKNDKLNVSMNNLKLGGNSPIRRSNNLNLNRLRENALPNRGNDMALPKKAINSKPAGMFASYAKYVDIKSGSLNFSGKASLHSKGIDFSNGSSFRISMDDLEFLEELGRGNYGVVSKVLHKPTGIIMAMKEVRLELDDAKFTQILMELEILHSCVSDCIVDFYGAFFVEGAVYMCMEYMKGGSLDKIYGDGISEIPLAYITKRVVLGLKQLKDDHNIIHRDVKPTNILVNENGKVKLCDFGVSGNLVASLARTNIGCQSYMAPERIKHTNPNDSSYSVQSDIWSLGLSILEISKGCYPYPPETYNNIFSQLSAIVDGEPPELSRGKFSEDAQDFVRQCLHKNPDGRPGYADLLKHPWLNKYSDEQGQSLMAELVRHKISEKSNNNTDKKSSNTENTSDKINNNNNNNNTNNGDDVDNRNRVDKKIPALHKGGLNQ